MPVFISAPYKTARIIIHIIINPVGVSCKAVM
jgi:hypothetical protein